ncbi:hypothetical protein PIB30_067622 [Stylosanthes scabra]|uniref:14-3-3 domain-containing protein n=1 Tax=Stylosanthes scabra TaxID=79078 RepID=A0ABU6TME4_9FABA|nr:hypothetical protein [Stylosanthes scabra]
METGIQKLNFKPGGFNGLALGNQLMEMLRLVSIMQKYLILIKIALLREIWKLLLLLSPPSRENFIYIAKLTEQAECYQELVDVMKNVAKLNIELTVEERNILSVGYKNVAGSRRASRRMLSSI